MIENNTNIAGRIKDIIDYKGISINKFSEIMGTSNSYFNKVIKNNTNIGIEIASKIIRIFPDINPGWLLTGEGSMLQEGESRQRQGPCADPKSSSPAGESEIIKNNYTMEQDVFKELLKSKQETLQSKDEVINALKKNIESLEEQIRKLKGEASGKDQDQKMA